MNYTLEFKAALEVQKQSLHRDIERSTAAWSALLARLDAARTDRIYREALAREYGEVPSPVLLGYVGGQLCHRDGTRQLTMFGRVIATVPPLFPPRQYGKPCFLV